MQFTIYYDFIELFCINPARVDPDLNVDVEALDVNSKHAADLCGRRSKRPRSPDYYRRCHDDNMLRRQ